jgi:hypothetical protein
MLKRMSSRGNSKRFIGASVLLSAALLVAFAATAKPSGSAGYGVSQEPTEFRADGFTGEAPTPEALWITKSLHPEVERIMGHGLGVLRVRYWRRGERTAWILDEIGKDKPITTGIVVNAGRIERTKVLIFRESRGWEVRYPRFLQQFRGAEIENRQLDRRIDGITGATLSVRAVTKVAHLALFFHQWVSVARHTESDQSSEP